jgi:hypothetical protein
MGEGKQVPSVGRVVHYVAYGTPGGEFPAGEHRAAIITEVYPDIKEGDPVDGTPWQTDMQTAGICVLNPTGFYFLRRASYDATAQEPGSWHWPEYVPAR